MESKKRRWRLKLGEALEGVRENSLDLSHSLSLHSPLWGLRPAGGAPVKNCSFADLDEKHMRGKNGSWA